MCPDRREPKKEFGKENGQIHEGILALRKAGMTNHLWQTMIDEHILAAPFISDLRIHALHKFLMSNKNMHVNAKKAVLFMAKQSNGLTEPLYMEMPNDEFGHSISNGINNAGNGLGDFFKKIGIERTFMGGHDILQIPSLSFLSYKEGRRIRPNVEFDKQAILSQAVD